MQKANESGYEAEPPSYDASGSQASPPSQFASSQYTPQQHLPPQFPPAAFPPQQYPQHPVQYPQPYLVQYPLPYPQQYQPLIQNYPDVPVSGAPDNLPSNFTPLPADQARTYLTWLCFLRVLQMITTFATGIITVIPYQHGDFFYNGPFIVYVFSFICFGYSFGGLIMLGTKRLSGYYRPSAIVVDVIAMIFMIVVLIDWMFFLLHIFAVSSLPLPQYIAAAVFACSSVPLFLSTIILVRSVVRLQSGL